MNSYTPDKKIRVSFDLLDDCQTASVVITDENDAVITTVLLTETEVTARSFNCLVDSEFNSLATGATKGIRTLTMTQIDSEDVEEIDVERYYLISPLILQKSVNSLMTFTDALMIVPEMTNLTGWNLADDGMKKAALIESFHNLDNYNLSLLYSYKTIGEYPVEEFDNLTDRMKRDFQRAQLLQADYLLGGQPEGKIRDTGIISRSVGESTSFFRTTKKLNYGISDLAYRYIVRYLNKDTRLENG